MKPINKKLWGANAENNIKVQFHNGTSSVRGYILKQVASRRFRCEDEHGVLAICNLVDKASAQLGAGEMSITVKFDNGTTKQITKIASHLAYFSDHTYMPWTFDPSTSDGKVQIEEAGTNPAMDSATDLEGDDVNIAADYPVPGSGTYLLGSNNSAIGYLGSFLSAGIPFEPSGSKTNSETAIYGNGLRRDKWNGNFCAANNTNPSLWDYNWMGTTDFLGETFDQYVSFGNQNDGPVTPGGSHFSMVWKGWVKAPVTQDYNWYGKSDDHMAVWIGDDAKNAPAFNTYIFAGNNSTMSGSNSITMDSTKWYPIRIWFSEFTGGCNCQLFFHGANSVKYNGQDFAWKFNPQGEGW